MQKTEENFYDSIYAPDIEPRRRPQTIFQMFDSLQSGQVLELINDHEPRPLHCMFMIEREGQFDWTYLEEGPSIWRVAIRKR
ncbi:DUF2249 domain-containing protein [Bacillus tianshenii]|nr:DUF2249 domain-containing protein [Bacillus tianshenii]